MKQKEDGKTIAKHPFALAKHEIDFDSLPFSPFDETVSMFDIPINKFFDIAGRETNRGPFLYDSFKRQLLGGLKESRGYKFLFDYAFPLYDLCSYYTILSIASASKSQGVPINWDGTKAALIILITMTNNRGRYDHTSGQPLIDNPSDFSKAFDEAFDIIQSCGSLLPCNLINAGLGSLSSFGFAMKFAIKTPKLIFKGLTELIDPNISLAIKIKCLQGQEVSLEFISDILELLGYDKTPLGIAYLLLFGQSDFDLGTDLTINIGDTEEGLTQSKFANRLLEDCSE